MRFLNDFYTYLAARSQAVGLLLTEMITGGEIPGRLDLMFAGYIPWEPTFPSFLGVITHILGVQGLHFSYMGVSRNRGKTTKMDGENNGKPYYIIWMIWGYHFFWKHSYRLLYTMGTHVSFIFRGYNPYIGGSRPSFFMVMGSKGIDKLPE